MKSLNTLFEEDIEMQDAIEDMNDLVDDTDDIILGVIEDRYTDESAHLFTNEDVTLEELQLKEDVDELLDDKFDKVDLSDEDIDDLLDDDDFEDYDF